MAAFLITSGVLTAASVAQAKSAQSDQRKAQKVQSRIEEVKARKERVRQVQEQRILQARAQSSAESGGTGTSSTTAGAQASLQSQLGANLGFLDMSNNANRVSSRFLQKASRHQSNVGTFGALANFATTAASTGLGSKPDTSTGESG